MAIYKASSLSDTGPRGHNEDSIALIKRKTEKSLNFMLCVADGVGGLEKGELASTYINTSLSEWYEENQEAFENLDSNELKNYINSKVCDIHSELLIIAEEKGISYGSTLTLFLLTGNKYTICQVGDSKAYIYEKGRIRKITKDQTAYQMELDKGKEPEKEEKERLKRTILQAVGHGEIFPQFYEGILEGDYKILTCSDGLTGKISEKELEIALKEDIPCKEIINKLIAKAREKGERDNISCIVLSRKGE